MKLIFQAAGEPTYGAIFGRTDNGLTKDGRRKIVSAKRHAESAQLVIASHEPDVTASARILLGELFAKKILFLTELGIDFPKPHETVIELWKVLQRLRQENKDGCFVILVRSGMIDQIVLRLCANFTNFNRIRHLVTRTCFNHGSTLCLSTGMNPRIEFTA